MVKLQIERKNIKGKTYLYLSKKAKINGRVKRIWQTYLGPERKFEEKFETIKLQLNDSWTVTTKEFGYSVALLQIAQQLQLPQIIDEVIPKREQGLSVGQYFLLAIINRCDKPSSKYQLHNWFTRTYLPHLFPTMETYLNRTSMAYVNHFRKFTPEAIKNIQQMLNHRLKDIFDVKMDQLFYDPTNFFTYINPKETQSQNQTLPRHGRSKENRHILNLVGLAMVCTADGGLPLFHHVYPGNIQDAKLFKTQHQEIVQHLRSLGMDPKEVRLVFDKGNISEDAFVGIDESKLRCICSVRPSSHKDLNELREDDFEMIELPNKNVVGIREFRRQLHGKERRLIVCFNKNKQSWSSKTKTSKLTKRIDSINEFFTDRLNKRKWGSVENVKAKIEKLLGKKFLEYVDMVVNKDETGIISYSVTIDEAYLDKENGKLGKSYVMTNDYSLPAKDVVWLYRKQHTVENLFSLLKEDTNAVPVKPIYHRLDESIRAHILSCVLGVLLMLLLERDVSKFLPSVSRSEMKQGLDDIKVAYLEFNDQHVKKKLIINSDLAKKLEKNLKLGLYL